VRVLGASGHSDLVSAIVAREDDRRAKLPAIGDGRRSRTRDLDDGDARGPRVARQVGKGCEGDAAVGGALSELIAGAQQSAVVAPALQVGLERLRQCCRSGADDRPPLPRRPIAFGRQRAEYGGMTDGIRTFPGTRSNIRQHVKHPERHSRPLAA